jgi:ribose 5-phosphate isomerase A
MKSAKKSRKCWTNWGRWRLNPKPAWIEQAKRNAAIEATKHVKDGFVVGLGSGTTAAYAIEEIAYRMKHEDLHVLGVPTSHQAFMLAVKHRIPITTLDEYPTLDLTIDGADQIDPNLDLIKGMGGALLREKIVASASRKSIVIADATKKVKILGQDDHPVPIEALPFASTHLIKRLQTLGGKPTLREAAKKLGPVVTDDGNFIIDAVFGEIAKPLELQRKLKDVAGVVETGLFLKMTDTVYIGKQSGMEKLE